ncbi:MAG: GNAT family N-acetyltransferase [Bacteriovoracia bacterium]
MNITGNFQLEEASADVLQLDQDFFPHPWTSAQWEGLNWKTHSLYTWRERSLLVAFALFGTLPGDDAAHLYKILVLPERRGDGTAHKFWNQIARSLKDSGFFSIYLEVEASNDRAIAFYQKAGFTILRRNLGYYSNGEDALMMSATL